VWSKEGNQGVDWILGNGQFIIHPPEAKIFIIATSNEWNFGDISIDDIFIDGGSCQESRVLENEFGSRMIRFSNFFQKRKINNTSILENSMSGNFFIEF